MRAGPSALIFGEPVVAYVAGRLGCRGWDACSAIGTVRDGRIVGGVVFHEWWPEKGVVEVTMAADDPRWITRAGLRFFADYAFGFARLVVARTSETNTRARSIWRRLGGREYPVPDLWADGEAGVILTLRRGDMI